MVSVTLIYLLLNILLIISIVFSNAFKARVLSTTFFLVYLMIILIKLFDKYINGNLLESSLINLIYSLNLTDSSSRYVLFFAGLIVLLQCFVLWITLYALFRRFVPYQPPILLSKHEERNIFYESLFWKIVLFLTTNFLMIFTLRIVNYAADLEYGFLEIIFSFGFGV